MGDMNPLLIRISSVIFCNILRIPHEEHRQ